MVVSDEPVGLPEALDGATGVVGNTLKIRTDDNEQGSEQKRTTFLPKNAGNPTLDVDSMTVLLPHVVLETDNQARKVQEEVVEEPVPDQGDKRGKPEAPTPPKERNNNDFPMKTGSAPRTMDDLTTIAMVAGIILCLALGVAVT